MSEPTGARRYGVGGGDAYYDAVRYGGYEGTREQFGKDQAEFAKNASDVAEAKETVERDAEEVRNTKNTFENTTVPEAIRALDQAGDDQILAITQKGEEVSQQVETVGTEQKDAVANEGRARVQAVKDEGDTQVQRVIDAGNEQVGRVEETIDPYVQQAEQAQAAAEDAQRKSEVAQGKSETAASNAEQFAQHAQDLVDTLPDDYVDMLEDVSGLNETKDIRTVSGDIVTFESAYADMPLKKLTVNIEPVQEGTGDPSPDNIRPITGWTGANVMRTDVNVLDLADAGIGAASYYNRSSGRISIGGTGATMSGTNPIIITNITTWRGAAFFSKPLKAGQQCVVRYRVSGENKNQIKRTVYIVDKNNNIVSKYAVSSSVDYDENYVYTSRPIAVSNGDRIVFCIESANTQTIELYDLSINYPISDTDYHEYIGGTYDITFPSEAGTVYGGKLEINEDGSGVLTVDRFKRELATMTWRYYSNAFYTNNINDYTKAQTILDGICNVYQTTGDSNLDNGIGFNSHVLDGNNRIRIKDSRFTTTAELISYLSEVGAECVTRFTPQTYNLTASQVTTLLGTNTIWADTGNVEVQYGAYISTVKNDLGERVPKLMIAPIEKTTTASKPYAVNEFLIMGDKLYIVTANIASGGTITIGTNVSETTIGAQITALLNA